MRSKIGATGVALVTMLALAMPITASAASSGTWIQNPANGHWYVEVDGLTWSQTEAFAVNLGGHLVAINDLAEQDWLAATFTDDSLWIGFNDVAEEGTWVWTSGEPVTYTHWWSGEPNNAYDLEDVAVMNFGRYGPTDTWNDYPSEQGCAIDPFPACSGFAGIVELTQEPGFDGAFTMNISTNEDGQGQYVVGWGWSGPVTISIDGSPVMTGVGQTWSFNPATGHFYTVLEGYPWVDAEMMAQSDFGGHLVTINDAAEQAWLSTTFPQENIFIGFNDRDVEGTWVWTSGEPVTYTNWVIGEPNDANEELGGEDMAVMNWTDPGGNVGWNDLPEFAEPGGEPQPVSSIVEAEAPSTNFMSWGDTAAFEPGQLVTVSDGVHEKSLLLANLAVTTIDPYTGSVAGSCEVGMDVHLEYSSYEGQPPPTQLTVPCEGGAFEGSFAPLELPNPPEGSFVEARQWDEDGDLTQVDAYYPHYATGPASARVDKVVDPTNSGQEAAGWTMTLSWTGGSETGTTVALVDPETGQDVGRVDFATELQDGVTYTITEAQRGDGWTYGNGDGDCTFTVHYPADEGRLFTCSITNTRGFLSPVENPPLINTVKAGRAIPLRFTLDGFWGLDLAAGSPSSWQVDCSNPLTEYSDPVPAVPTRGGGLSYNVRTDIYSYSWSTSKDWANTCRRLELTLFDGETVFASFFADFRFTK